MSDADNSEKAKVHRSGSELDADLQRELEEALGGMSVEDMLEAETPTRGGGKRAAGKQGMDGQDLRKGTVIAVQGEDIFVSLGGPVEGWITVSQFEDEDVPAVGDVIEVAVERYDPSEGLLILTRKGAVQAATWENLQEGLIVEGRVTGHNKGGLEMDLKGIRAFMPISQVERFGVDDLSPYVGQVLRCTVTEVKRGEKNVVLSRRDLLDAEAEASKEKMFETLKEGQVLPGVVRSIMPYGAFVDIGGVDGLVHVRDMSYARVEDPHSAVTEGQKVNVMILKIDREEKKISLGLKQVMPDPWVGAEGRWAPGTVVAGRVVRLMDFGVFVELDKGVDGLIPVSELTFERRVGHPSEVVNVGDVVKVRVMKVDLPAKRISLSLKRTGDDPWTGASVRWPKDSIIEGVVTRLADFGAFVELTGGVEGLVHISELTDKHVRTVADAVQVGKMVQAKVLSVDEEGRRIGLSIKQAAVAGLPPTVGAAEEAAPAAAARKRKTPLKGGLEGGGGPMFKLPGQ
ncbi:MAG: S1 RNA-binding domain-containing protein [Planctomycetota bacterium]|nr:S1 RNA-binding domain-containing protein [Planctomycetota bacterium]